MSKTRKIVLGMVGLLLFALTSCNDEGDKVTSLILGDWFSLDNNGYIEYYFDEQTMSIHGLSGNIYSYEYHLRKNKKLELVDNSGNSSSHLFEDIVKVDSFEIVFKNRTLHRLNDNQTLGRYLDKKIEYDSLSFYFMQRNSAAIPIDTLLKMAGEPIDVDELFEVNQ